MKNKILSVLLLILIASCTKNYSVKTINNMEYIHVFKSFYYKVNPGLIENFYSSSSNNIYWTKFAYKIDNFAKVIIYITGEKKTKEIINNYNNNFNYEIRKQFNINPDFKNEYFEELKKIFYVAFVNHFNPNPKVEPVKGNWQKGYEWSKKGASSEIRIYFIHKNMLIDYEILVEYQPCLLIKKEAEKKYSEIKNKIGEIISAIYFN